MMNNTILKKGSMLWFDNDKGYGFLSAEGEDHPFFIHGSILIAGCGGIPQPADPVLFSVTQEDHQAPYVNYIRVVS